MNIKGDYNGYSIGGEEKKKEGQNTGATDEKASKGQRGDGILQNGSHRSSLQTGSQRRTLRKTVAVERQEALVVMVLASGNPIQSNQNNRKF
jgi:hypothetical protein